VCGVGQAVGLPAADETACATGQPVVN